MNIINKAISKSLQSEGQITFHNRVAWAAFGGSCILATVVALSVQQIICNFYHLDTAQTTQLSMS